MTMDKDGIRFTQIFSARLVLECFGGGGAIWGFSEVITFRNPVTQEFWRFHAQVIGFIFFLRWLLQISDYVKKQSRDEASTSRLFQIFSARMVLEVWGGAGAIWGFSEALTLRNHETVEFWRHAASIVGVIFFTRWCLQVNDFLKQMKGEELDSIDPWVRFYQIFSAKLVLEVFGGAGAIWGFSEVLTLRNPATTGLWRFNALTVGFVMFIRFLMQMKDYVISVKYPNTVLVISKKQWIRLAQVYSAKIVLEVFGGGGAIWGFSEVITLRHAGTQEFWRFNASVVAFIFFCRYCCQIFDSLMDILEEGKAEGARIEKELGLNTDSRGYNTLENTPLMP
jgi:ABC-type multidrug transport system fused ATPase/permease subunit